MYCEPIVLGEQTEYPLKGILTLPKEYEEGDVKVPAAVFVHGSGSSNMDEKLYRVTPFKDLAEGLAARGIASLRYDKRSFTYGFKMIRSKEVITVKQETIEDAILAAELLRQDHRIDPDRIFIVGHSMGAMLAPRIDAEGGNFRGLVLMAGSTRKLEDVLIDQTKQAMEELNPILRSLTKGQTKKLEKKFKGLYEMSDEEAKSKKVGGGTTLYYFKELGEHPVEDYLGETKKPMLILQGEKDVQVSVEKDFQVYKELLKDHPDVTFKLYEGLNHCFMPAVYESILKAKQEYNKEQHIGSEVLDDIANWIKER